MITIVGTLISALASGLLGIVHITYLGQVRDPLINIMNLSKVFTTSLNICNKWDYSGRS